MSWSKGGRESDAPLLCWAAPWTRGHTDSTPPYPDPYRHAHNHPHTTYPARKSRRQKSRHTRRSAGRNPPCIPGCSACCLFVLCVWFGVGWVIVVVELCCYGLYTHNTHHQIVNTPTHTHTHTHTTYRMKAYRMLTLRRKSSASPTSCSRVAAVPSLGSLIY